VTDPNPGNNSATDSDTVDGQADLSITKTDGVASVAAGGSTIYTIVASNAGPSAVSGGTVTDTFPAGLTCTWTCSGTGTCAAAGSGNIADTVTLAAGNSVTYVATCNVSPSATGTIANTATVSSTTNDPNGANTSSTDTDSVTAPTTITGTKSVAGAFNEGSNVTYTIVLANGTPSTQLDNPGDEFTDVLPPSLILVSANASSGTPVATVGTNTVTWNGQIPAGGSVTITIVATIASGTTGVTISNQGTFAYDADGNGTNESNGVTDDPSAGGAGDPTSFVVGGILAIPTLDVLGLAALAGGLAIAARRRLRRR
jgi:uncharacterized repeat protein (TIGR01451 family)